MPPRVSVNAAPLASLPISSLTVAQLKQRLDSLGISYRPHELKAQLLSRLQSALDNGATETPRSESSQSAAARARMRRRADLHAAIASNSNSRSTTAAAAAAAAASSLSTTPSSRRRTRAAMSYNEEKGEDEDEMDEDDDGDGHSTRFDYSVPDPDQRLINEFLQEEIQAANASMSLRPSDFLRAAELQVMNASMSLRPRRRSAAAAASASSTPPAAAASSSSSSNRAILPRRARRGAVILSNAPVATAAAAVSSSSGSRRSTRTSARRAGESIRRELAAADEVARPHRGGMNTRRTARTRTQDVDVAATMAETQRIMHQLRHEFGLARHLQLHHQTPFDLSTSDTDDDSSDEDDEDDESGGQNGLPQRSESEESEDDALYWNHDPSTTATGASSHSSSSAFASSFPFGPPPMSAGMSTLEHANLLRRHRHAELQRQRIQLAQHVRAAESSLYQHYSSVNLRSGLRFKRDVKRVMMMKSAVPPMTQPMSIKQLNDLMATITKLTNFVDLSNFSTAPAMSDFWSNPHFSSPSSRQRPAIVAPPAAAAASSSVSSPSTRLPIELRDRSWSSSLQYHPPTPPQQVMNPEPDVAPSSLTDPTLRRRSLGPPLRVPVLSASRRRRSSAITPAAAASNTIPTPATTVTTIPDTSSDSETDDENATSAQRTAAMARRAARRAGFDLASITARLTTAGIIPTADGSYLTQPRQQPPMQQFQRLPQPPQQATSIVAHNEMSLLVSVFARPDVLAASFHIDDIISNTPTGFPYDLVTLRLTFARPFTYASDTMKRFTALLQPQLRLMFGLMWKFNCEREDVEEWLGYTKPKPKLAIDITGDDDAPMTTTDIVLPCADLAGPQKRIRFTGTEVPTATTELAAVAATSMAGVNVDTEMSVPAAETGVAQAAAVVAAPLAAAAVSSPIEVTTIIPTITYPVSAPSSQDAPTFHRLSSLPNVIIHHSSSLDQPTSLSLNPSDQILSQQTLASSSQLPRTAPLSSRRSISLGTASHVGPTSQPDSSSSVASPSSTRNAPTSHFPIPAVLMPPSAVPAPFPQAPINYDDDVVFSSLYGTPINHATLAAAANADANTSTNANVVDLTLSDDDDDEVPLPSSASTSFTQAPRMTYSSLAQQQQLYAEVRNQAINRRSLQSPSASSIRSMTDYYSDVAGHDRADRRVVFCSNCARVNVVPTDARANPCIQCGTPLPPQAAPVALPASLNATAAAAASSSLARQSSDVTPMDVDQPTAGSSSSLIHIPRVPASVTSEFSASIETSMADVPMSSNNVEAMPEPIPFASGVASSSSLIIPTPTPATPRARAPLTTVITYSYFVMFQLPQLSDTTSYLCKEIWPAFAAAPPEVHDQFISLTSSLPASVVKSELTRWVACVQSCISLRLSTFMKQDNYLRGCVRSLAIFHRVNEALKLKYPTPITFGPAAATSASSTSNSPVLDRSLFMNDAITSLDSYFGADYTNYLLGEREAELERLHEENERLQTVHDNQQAEIDRLLQARAAAHSAATPQPSSAVASDAPGGIERARKRQRRLTTIETEINIPPTVVAEVAAAAAASKVPTANTTANPVALSPPSNPTPKRLNPNAVRVVRSSQFAFASYPFLLDASSFGRILLFESQREQSALLQSERRAFPYHHHHLQDQGALILTVRREYVLADTLAKLGCLSSPSDLKRPLKVVWAGEDGIDAGGPKRELFSLLIRELLLPEYNMFLIEAERYVFNPMSLFSIEHDMDTTPSSSTSSSHTRPLHPEAISTLSEYELVGIVLGLSLYNSVQLEARFPAIIYKKLLAKAREVPTHLLPKPGTIEYTLADLADSHPDLAKGLHQLLSYPATTNAELDDVFGLTFTVDHSVFGMTITKELIPNGASVGVTLENRQQYVDAYVRYILHDSIQQQFDAFARGFYKVVSKKPLQLLTHPSDLELLLCGTATSHANWPELESAAVYDGFQNHTFVGGKPNTPVVKHFWSWFHSLAVEMKLRVLAFVTGSNRIPIKGLRHAKFVVVNGGESPDPLPSSHTCFSQLVLPNYKSEEMLKNKFMLAINEGGEGFGLK